MNQHPDYAVINACKIPLNEHAYRALKAKEGYRLIGDWKDRIFTGIPYRLGDDNSRRIYPLYVSSNEGMIWARVFSDDSEPERIDVAKSDLKMIVRDLNDVPPIDQPGLSPPRIVCAANSFLFVDDMGMVNRITVAGARHYDSIMHPVIRSIAHRDRSAESTVIDADQGFIDQHGRYYTRSEAWVIAEANNQIVNRGNWGTGTLYSENLY